MIDRKLFISVMVILLLTSYDLLQHFNNSSSIKETNSSINEDLSLPPTPKIKSHMAPTIKFLFCRSSGYRNLFKQFSELVRQNYPQMSIIGEHYPSRWINALLARLISMIKMALLICLLFGQNPFSLCHWSTPTIYSWALRNKIYACLMIFFFANSLESYLLSTGAFEIFINDLPLWSKLENARLPSSDEFVHMLKTFAVNDHHQ